MRGCLRREGEEEVRDGRGERGSLDGVKAAGIGRPLVPAAVRCGCDWAVSLCRVLGKDRWVRCVCSLFVTVIDVCLV